MEAYKPGMTFKEKAAVGLSVAALYALFSLAITGVIANGFRGVRGSDTKDLDIVTVSANPNEPPVCKATPDPLYEKTSDFLRVDSDDGQSYTIKFLKGSPLRGQPATIPSGSVTTIRANIVPDGDDGTATFPYVIQRNGVDCKTVMPLIGIKVGH